MIKINLLKRRKPGGGKSGGLFGTAFGRGLETPDIKDFDWRHSPIPRAAAAMLLVYLAQWEIDSLKQEMLQKEDVKIAAVQAEIDDIGEKLSKVKGFEPLKKQLEEDEKNIQSKLNIINTLLENRDAPSRMLKQLSQIIPEEVWLNTLGVQAGKITINGGSTSYNLVSDFMRNVGDSTLFTGVSLSQVNETEKEGIKFQQFEISAQTRGF